MDAQYINIVRSLWVTWWRPGAIFEKMQKFLIFDQTWKTLQGATGWPKLTILYLYIARPLTEIMQVSKWPSMALTNFKGQKMAKIQI